MADHAPETDFTNRLSHETSPYLLQHKHNPVDWYPWGEEAFDAARQRQQPIFLSVGYSTCYWCHVMERQVFEDPEQAQVANERFVCVKVDREERPDVDDIYMVAVQAMTGRGGWPMSVFLTPPGAAGENDPGLKPFWAGTYLPPQPMHGMRSFTDVCKAIDEAWQERREQVVEQADKVAAAVSQHLAQPEDPQPLTVESIQKAANQLVDMYEEKHGGFGGAPKFPQPGNLMLLMRVFQNNPDEKLWQAIRYTLERMARGGMYDQVGGGFHRYSVDEHWLVPHFEKMLYDNGQLVEAYAEAHKIQPDPQDPGLYPRVIRETCEYLLREMVDDSGAFYSAQDAEVDGKEGLNYLWTEAGVREALQGDPETAELTELALRLYGLDRGTNFQDPHHRDEPRRNVLFLPKRLDELAAAENMSIEDLLAARDTINRRLLSVRDQRKQPGTDDKVLAGWNGLMIAGLARAGADLEEPRLLQAAERAADAVLEHMSDGQGELLRTMRRGEAKIPGFLEDYAFLTHGLLMLYRATQTQRHLEAAKRLAAAAEARFDASATHGGGYFETRENQPDLFVRVRGTYDGAVPSGNSVMVHNLLNLYKYTEDEAYMERAVKDLRSFGASLPKMGAAMQQMQHALLRAFEMNPALAQTAAADVHQQGEKAGEPSRRQALSVLELEPRALDLSAGEAKLTMTLEIGEEFHINGPEPGDENLVGTRLELRGPESLSMEVDYPEPEHKQYATADGSIPVYEGQITLRATIRGQVPEDEPPRLVFRYQPCTDRTCLPPKDVELPVTFEG